MIFSIEKRAKEDLITLQTKWGNLKLQIDNGASVNIISLDNYTKLTNDVNLERIRKSSTICLNYSIWRSKIASYGRNIFLV